MTLIEGATLTVLPAETDRRALEHQGAEGQCYCHAVIEGTIAPAPLSPLVKQFFDFGVYMEVFWIGRQLIADLLNGGGTQGCVDLVFMLVGSAGIIRPITGKICQRHSLLHLGRLLLGFR